MNGKQMGPGAPQPDAASARGLTQSQPWPPDPHCAPFRLWLISPLFRARHTPAGPTLSPPRCRSCSFAVTDPRLGGGRRAGSQEEGTLALGFRYRAIHFVPKSKPKACAVGSPQLAGHVMRTARARLPCRRGHAACGRTVPPDAWD